MERWHLLLGEALGYNREERREIDARSLLQRFQGVHRLYASSHDAATPRFVVVVKGSTLPPRLKRSALHNPS